MVKLVVIEPGSEVELEFHIHFCFSRKLKITPEDVSNCESLIKKYILQHCCEEN